MVQMAPTLAVDIQQKSLTAPTPAADSQQKFLTAPTPAADSQQKFLTALTPAADIERKLLQRQFVVTALEDGQPTQENDANPWAVILLASSFLANLSSDWPRSWHCYSEVV